MWAFRKLQSFFTRTPVYRVGWATFESFFYHKRRTSQLRSFSRIRAGNIREWINAHTSVFYNELYHPKRQYDIVIFHKIMDSRCQAEVQRIQQYGGKVIFDANVNYYEIWGEYHIPDTQPTKDQQRDAIWMTSHADWVVADSSYIAGIARKFAKHVTWIPDNVNLDIYDGEKIHQAKQPVILIWSGWSTKAVHLLEIKDVLARLEHVELRVVSEKEPEVMPTLQKCLPCHFFRFKAQTYAAQLLDSDIIISPKRLVNGYALGHSEYKISLGMAVGLPAVASPQQSYIDAISYKQGGIIADTNQEWLEALQQLVKDYTLRHDMGLRARQTVIERYSTPVVAAQYLHLLQHLKDRA